MVIDIGVMGNWATQIVAIGGLCVGVYWICSQIIAVKSKLAEHEDCIQDSKEERKLSIEVQKTILEVVAQNKNNGNVEAAMDKIDRFLNEKSHE